MILSTLIRKHEKWNAATAIPANFATDTRSKVTAVARIATVAVANACNDYSSCLAAEEEFTVRAWLAQIQEIDLTTIADVIALCHLDSDAKSYFSERAYTEVLKPPTLLDDRRSCVQCANLIARRCQAAKRGEILASPNYEPIIHQPRRCEGYAPGLDDPDRQRGRERWGWMF